MGQAQTAERQRVGQFLYLRIFRLPVATVQANLVQHIQCHPPPFLDHTQQTLERFFTLHLALLVRVAPVQIHIGGMVLDVIPEGLTLEWVNLEESHMRVVRQVDLKADIRALLVRDGRVVQVADHWWSQTYQKSLKLCLILMGGIQVRLSDIRCLNSRLFTLFHLQCLLSHLTTNEVIHPNFSLIFSLNHNPSFHNNQRRRQSLFCLRRHSHQLFSPLQSQWGPLFILQ